MNNYLTDSGKFFRFTARGIQDKIDDFETIQLSLNFALGLERLLKGILYDINPTYILIEPGFKHSLPHLYPDKVIAETKSSGEIVGNPNEDVITFRNSLLRAQHISKSCFDNKNLLFNISNARDIIVHHELKKLDIPKLKEILLRDFYPFLKSISEELNIKQGHFFDGSHIKLSKISSTHQTDLENRLKLILDSHLGIWNTMKNRDSGQDGRSGYVIDKINVTNEVLNSPNKESTKCPACSNEAVIYLKPIYEFNPFEKKEILIGHEVKKLKCQFCKLEIQDAATLDHLGIRDRKIKKLEECSRCGKPIGTDNATGLCQECDEYYGTEN